MKQNIKIAKELVKLAKSLIADNKKATYGLMLENPDAPKHTGDFPILKINVNESDIINSEFYKQMYKIGEEKLDEWINANDINLSGYSKEEIEEAKRYIEMATDMCLDDYFGGKENYIQQYVVNYIEDIINGLKKLAKNGTTYMDGNFADWSEYYDRQPMKNAQDVIEAAHESLNALGTFGFKYNFLDNLDDMFHRILRNDINEDQYTSDIVKQIIKKYYNL